jgi:hypothetical protein
MIVLAEAKCLAGKWMNCQPSDLLCLPRIANNGLHDMELNIASPGMWHPDSGIPYLVYGIEPLRLC